MIYWLKNLVTFLFTIVSLLVMQLIAILLVAEAFKFQFSIRIKGTIEEAILLCKIKNYDSVTLWYEDTEKDYSSKIIDLGSMRIYVDKHSFVTARIGDKEDYGYAKQYEYGRINGLYQSHSGEIFAFGDERSYRLGFRVKDATPSLTHIKSLPTLFERYCDFFDRIFHNCMYKNPRYSSELKAVFLSGYPVLGSLISLVLGLKSGDLNISHSTTPFYFADIPNTGTVLLAGIHDFAIFDGKIISPCS